MALFRKKQQPTPRVNDVVAEPIAAARPDSASVPWSKLLPMLKRVDAYAFAEVGPYLVSRPVGPFLVEVVAIDSAEAMQLINTTMPVSQQAPAEEFFATARDNMSALTLNGNNFSMDTRPVTAYSVEGPAGYATSWVFRPDRLVQMAAAVGDTGELLVIPCDRDLLYVCPANDLGIVEQTLDVVWSATMAAEYEHAISPALYRMSEGGLVPWQSPVPGPVDVKQRRALALVSCLSYVAQYEWLTADDDARLAAMAQPPNGSLHLAGKPSFATGRDGDPSSRSISVLGRFGPEDDNLLCPLEWVYLSDQGDNLLVPYAAFAQVCANLMSPEDLLPLPMVRVHGWPSEQQWAQLQQHQG